MMRVNGIIQASLQSLEDAQKISDEVERAKALNSVGWHTIFNGIDRTDMSRWQCTVPGQYHTMCKIIFQDIMKMVNVPTDVNISSQTSQRRDTSYSMMQSTVLLSMSDCDAQVYHHDWPHSDAITHAHGDSDDDDEGNNKGNAKRRRLRSDDDRKSAHDDVSDDNDAKRSTDVFDPTHASLIIATCTPTSIIIAPHCPLDSRPPIELWLRKGEFVFFDGALIHAGGPFNGTGTYHQNARLHMYISRDTSPTDRAPQDNVIKIIDHDSDEWYNVLPKYRRDVDRSEIGYNALLAMERHSDMK